MPERARTKVDLEREVEGLRRQIETQDVEIRQRDRLHALAQMARGIVHDFNNALTPIMGAADFMITHQNILDSRDDTIHMLECIRSAAAEAKTMVSRLRAFYRPAEEVEIRPVYFNPLIKGVVQLIEPVRKAQESARHIQIQITTELGELPPVRASEAQMREVLSNILLNAIAAMPHGGRITVASEASDDKVNLWITDTGMGMSPEVLQRCFEPFFSTKPGNGNGIGLAMAYFVIENAGGKIRITSEPGVGTTVMIALPADTSDEAAQAPAPGTPARLLQLLVIDKEEHIRQVLQAYLQSAGHQVEIAESAARGGDLMRVCKFDCVLASEKTVGARAIDLVRALAQSGRSAAVILMRSYEAVPGKTAELPAGVDAAIERNITCAELLACIDRITESKSRAPAGKS